MPEAMGGVGPACTGPGEAGRAGVVVAAWLRPRRPNPAGVVGEAHPMSLRLPTSGRLRLRQSDWEEEGVQKGP